MTSARSAQGSWIGSRGDGRPARIRLIEASVRSRCSCHSACAIGSLVESVSVSAVAGRWRMPVPRSSRLNASSRVGQRNRASGNSAASASEDEQADADRARQERQRQPQSGPGRHQKQPDDAQNPGQMPARRAPTRSHIGPVAGPASAEAARRHPARARAVRGQVRRRSINSPGCRQISLAQRRQ